MPRKKSGTFDQGKYIQQFMKEKVTVKKVTFNKEKEKILLDWISGKPFSTYVKDLILMDMRLKREGDCNNCGKVGCEYEPDPGETCRINCPFWEARK